MATEHCEHQLKRLPESFTDATGDSFLVFECILCGSEITLMLDSEGEVVDEYVLPPERKSA